MRNELRPAVPALDRAREILELLAGAREAGLSAQELRARVRIPRASLYRLLRGLLESAWLAQDARSGRYRLGLGLLRLGFDARAASPLVRAGLPILRRAARETHEMSELAVDVGGGRISMLDVWQVEGTPLRVAARPGLSFGMNHQVAHGLCYLTFDGPRRLQEYLARLRTAAGRNAFQFRGPLPRHLEEACARWHELGYAWYVQRRPEGLNARLAVPVYDPHSSAGRLAASLGIVFDGEKLNALRAAEWAHALRACARDLEKAL